MNLRALLAVAPEVTTGVCSNGALVGDIAGGANTDVFAFPSATVQPLLDAIIREMVARTSVASVASPATLVPTLIMPIFFTFSGAYGFAGRAFGGGNAMSWYAPMATIQGASFAGITVGLPTARDFESGFFDRFLLAPMSRGTLIGGVAIPGWPSSCPPPRCRSRP